jgi:hypothetical protein
LAQFGEPAGNLVVEFGHGSGALAQRMLTRQLLLPSCSVNSSSLPFPTLWRLTSLPEHGHATPHSGAYNRALSRPLTRV